MYSMCKVVLTIKFCKCANAFRDHGEHINIKIWGVKRAIALFYCKR